MATVSADGAPHLVPITFVLLEGAALLTAVDHKPKHTRSLRRLQNIERNPQVSVLVDHYDDDWSQLWWVRADGSAQVRDRVEPFALRRLVERYPDYREHSPEGPFVTIAVERFVGWSAR